MSIYVFDLDGTLTPARLPMTDDFAVKFVPWLKQNKAYIASGSNLPKVIEQMGKKVMNEFCGIYCSMGNEFWAKGEYVYQNDFTPDAEFVARLEYFRARTDYPYTLYDNYIERRTGMINFSVLGRNCPYEERLRYQAWDNIHHERETIQRQLLAEFPQYEVYVGGSISMDIVPLGCSKAQVAHRLREKYPEEEILFFGDKTFAGGNDYELAQALRAMDNTKVIQVSGPDEVAEYLKI